jgi:hypothetical protein
MALNTARKPSPWLITLVSSCQWPNLPPRVGRRSGRTILPWAAELAEGGLTGV